MLQLFDSIRKWKARIAVMIVAALVCSLLGGLTAAPMAKAEETDEEIYTPDRVDLIAPVEGAVFLEEKDVLTGLEVTETTTNSITVAWDEMPGMTSYLVYYYDFEKSAYVFLDETKEQKYTWKDRKAGDEFYITVCAYRQSSGEQSHFAEPVHTFTRPEALTTFSIIKNTSKSITLGWEKVESATGYLIYRTEANGVETKVGSTTTLEYEDTGLKSGVTYRYRIRTYFADEENTGEYSEQISTTTNPAKPSMKLRAGNGRVKLTWTAVNGATGYRIYQFNGSQAVLIADLKEKSTVRYLRTGLKNGTKYYYTMTAYRTYKEKDYESSKATKTSVKPLKVAKTSTGAKLYKSKKAFLRSAAVKACSFVKKQLNYAKSIVLPGMTNTNVLEFGSKTMVPQGMTFAGSYLLVSAYDSKRIDNSVVYVMSRSRKKLLTTVVLPNKTHAGGLAYDGRNLWICQSTYLRSISFAQIKKAAVAKKKYLEIKAYGTKNSLGQQAAAVTYYKGFLWVASYSESNSGYLGSYRIADKTGKPVLTVCGRIKLPNRVQGLTFTSNGRLILSRSCQTNSTKRGYLHQLDVYKPNLKKAGAGKITLGKRNKVINMPSMNEEIAVSGKYLYVNFESVQFTSATKRVDRICAFKVAAVTKKEKAKKSTKKRTKK